MRGHENPHRHLQRSRKMSNCSIRGDHQIPLLNNSGGIKKRSLRVQRRIELLDRKLAIRNLFASRPLLQTDQAHARNACERSEHREWQRTLRIKQMLRVSLPAQADTKRVVRSE